jgi:hypothetical protein
MIFDPAHMAHESKDWRKTRLPDNACLQQANKIQQLPIVDETMLLHGLYLLDDLSAPAERENLMVIMAGGQGTRLRPHTESCPKPCFRLPASPCWNTASSGPRTF